MRDYERVTLKQGEPKIVSKKVYYRLRELEDKIENGTLIELPCKVGDTCYCIWQYEDFVGRTDTPFIEEDTVKMLLFENNQWKVVPSNWGERDNYWYKVKDILFTKAEAEKKLQELREGK